jgi:hypothetical protein
METNTDINIDRAAHLLEKIEQDVRELRQILGAGAVGYASQPTYSLVDQAGVADDGIEGIFDGERMVDYSGKTYQVSSNYASKSKLVEGDPLKLYITPDGKFFYKQLGPIERRTTPGVLRAEGNHYVVDAEDGATYNILTASVTYYMSLFNLRLGDRVMLLVPADQPSRWAVIDNML